MITIRLIGENPERYTQKADTFCLGRMYDHIAEELKVIKPLVEENNVCAMIVKANGEVVDHIIIILHMALHLWVAAFIVLPQAMMYCPITCSISDSSETLWLNALRDYAVLPCYVVCICYMHIIPWSPRDTAMIHYDVVTLIQCKSTF